MLGGVGNVNLPTPVFVAGGALCLLCGYLLGAVAGPDTPDRTTAEVSSYSPSTQELCLSGETIEDQDGADEDGKLCGTWRRTSGSTTPSKGDKFRFVSVESDGKGDGDKEQQTLIYGDVIH